MYPKLGWGLSYFPNKAAPIGIYARVKAKTANKKHIGKVFYFHHFDTKQTWDRKSKVPTALLKAATDAATEFYKIVSMGEWGSTKHRYHGSTTTGEPAKKGRPMVLTKANTSGIVGVREASREYPTLTGTSVYKAWVATWVLNGKTKVKWFGFGGGRAASLTSEEAKAKAIAYREKMIKKHYKPVELL